MKLLMPKGRYLSGQWELGFKLNPSVNPFDFDIVTEINVWVYTEDERSISHYDRDAGHPKAE